MSLLKKFFGKKKKIDEVKCDVEKHIDLSLNDQVENYLSFEEKIKLMEKSKNKNSENEWNNLDFNPSVCIDYKNERYLYLTEWKGEERKSYQLTERPVRSFNIDLIEENSKKLYSLRVVYD